jgi:hypothetical protein
MMRDPHSMRLNGIPSGLTSSQIFAGQRAGPDWIRKGEGIHREKANSPKDNDGQDVNYIVLSDK